MLTIFGKKKKEDQTPAESLSASQTEAPQPMSTPSQSPSYTRMAGTQNPVEDQPQYRPVREQLLHNKPSGYHRLRLCLLRRRLSRGSCSRSSKTSHYLLAS